MLGPQASRISSTSIARGGLVHETYDALRAWDPSASKQANVALLRNGPAISAVSESWRKDIVTALSRRLDPSERDASLVLLAKQGCNFDVWRPILLWHITRNEFLVRHFFMEFLFPRYVEGYRQLRADDLIPFLAHKSIQKRLKRPWQPPTLRRVANGLLQTAADFGLLTGVTGKAFVSYHLPEESFLYLLHAMADAEPNPRRLIDAADWRLYLMSTSDVERELLRLHQFRRLHYESAGSLAQLKLPCASSTDYARNLCA